MKAIAICVIGRPTPLFRDVSLVVDTLLCPRHDPPVAGSPLAGTLAQARRHLARRGDAVGLQVYSFESIEAFRAATQQELHPLRSGALSLELFFVDISSSGPAVDGEVC